MTDPTTPTGKRVVKRDYSARELAHAVPAIEREAREQENVRLRGIHAQAQADRALADQLAEALRAYLTYDEHRHRYDTMTVNGERALARYDKEWDAVR